MINYFSACNTLEDLKKEYQRLARIYHPDAGGPQADNAIMAEVNSQHDAVFVRLKEAHNRAAADSSTIRPTTETPEEFRAIIEALMKISGITVELCGSWLWISGNTKPNKEALKAAGCMWSNSKGMWYWRHAEDGCHWSRGKKSIGDIRLKYGSQVYSSNAKQAAAIEA